jgi:hypothetical protein
LAPGAEQADNQAKRSRGHAHQPADAQSSPHKVTIFHILSFQRESSLQEKQDLLTTKSPQKVGKFVTKSKFSDDFVTAKFRQ